MKEELQMALCWETFILFFDITVRDHEDKRHHGLVGETE